MPHLEINKEHNNCHLNIANPNNWYRKSDDGLWDIYVKSIELFSSTSRYEYGRQGRKSKWGDKMKKIFGMMS